MVTVDADAPLMQAGINSIAATHLSSQLRALSGVSLLPTLIFEQPTPRAIASHLAHERREELRAVSSCVLPDTFAAQCWAQRSAFGADIHTANGRC